MVSFFQLVEVFHDFKLGSGVYWAVAVPFLRKAGHE